MQKTWVQLLVHEDLLEKEMATHSSILAWWIPWTEEPGGLQSMGSQRVGHDLETKQQPAWDFPRLLRISLPAPSLRSEKPTPQSSGQSSSPVTVLGWRETRAESRPLTASLRFPPPCFCPKENFSEGRLPTQPPVPAIPPRTKSSPLLPWETLPSLTVY